MNKFIVFTNNYVFAMLQCALLTFAAGKLLRVKQGQKLIFAYHILFTFILFALMKIKITPLPFLNLFLMMTFSIILCRLFFSKHWGEIILFMTIIFNEMMLSDLIVGNIMAALVQTNISIFIETNATNRLIYSTLAFLLFFCSVSITCMYFEKISLQSTKKHWLAINTILSFCFIICIIFMQFNSDINSQGISILAIIVWFGFGLISFLIIKFFIDSCYNFQNEKSQLLARLKYEALEEQLKKQEQTIRDIRTIKHDMKHYIHNLTYMLQDGNHFNTDDFVDEIINKIDSSKSYTYCKSSIINGILNLKQEECDKKHISLLIKTESSFETILDPIDITAILYNLLDNAIEYVETLAGDERTIHISIYSHYLYECYVVSNPYNGTPIENNDFETTKQNRTEHGYGLYSVREIAKKYNGNVAIVSKNNKFRITVMLYKQ